MGGLAIWYGNILPLLSKCGPQTSIQHCHRLPLTLRQALTQQISEKNSDEHIKMCALRQRLILHLPQFEFQPGTSIRHHHPLLLTLRHALMQQISRKMATNTSKCALVATGTFSASPGSIFGPGHPSGTINLSC
jgi:hypothetical protein